MHFIGIILIGFIAGIIARFVAPGPNNPSGFILTTLLGIAGAFIATFIGQALGHYQPDEGAGLIGAVIGAVVSCSCGIAWCRRALYPTPVTDAGFRPQRPPRAETAFNHDSARRAGTPGDRKAAGVLALSHSQDGAPRRFGGACISDMTISIWPSTRRPCPAPPAQRPQGSVDRAGPGVGHL